MRKRLYLFILICWLAGVFVLLWYPRIPVPHDITKITFYDKYAHLVFFGVTMYLFLAIGIRWKKFRFFWTALFSFSIVTIINILGEFVQGYIPGRTPDFFDFFAGTIGVICAIPLTYMIFHAPKKKLMLHVCCAPCTTAVREALDAGYKLEFYFFNPNIHPESEYKKRLAEVKKLARTFGIKLHVGKYDYAAWKKAISGYEDELEGGSRCEFCFRYRLHETANKAEDRKIPLFTTTLSVSPHKNTLRINAIGERISRWRGIGFLSEDFKKNNGFQRSLVLSSKFGFYRQKYCGCEFSSPNAKRATRNA
jgi:predicted adenine nucleotide alpha hydrolase (AANH) superfamily ATPase/VanZ family protein